MLALAGCAMLDRPGGIFAARPTSAGAAQPQDPSAPAGLAAPEAVEMTPLSAPPFTTPFAPPSAPPGATGAQSADALDTATTAERAAASAPHGSTAGTTALGVTIASLGDPTAAGFWLRTPLVSAPAKGRVVAAGGASAVVDLIPSGGAAGAGSQISLSALRVLGLSLTDLPELSVFRL